MTLREGQQREDKGHGGGESTATHNALFLWKCRAHSDFSWAIWLHTSRRNAPEAACSSPKTLCIHASSPRPDMSTSVQCHYVSRTRRTFVHSVLSRALFLFFCRSARMLEWRFRDALPAPGTSVKANKFSVFMKSVVKVCFRLTWLKLERFMALQVVCRHDRAFAPFCPPSSFTALCCRLVWERTFLTPRDINTKNSLRVPNTPTPLWLEIIPLSADYLCTCTLKRFTNIAASLLWPTKQSSLSKLDAVVTAMRAFTPHSQVATVNSFSQWKHLIWLPGELKVPPIIHIWIMFLNKKSGGNFTWNI